MKKNKLRSLTILVAAAIVSVVGLASSAVSAHRGSEGGHKKPVTELTVGIFSPSLTTLVADRQGFLEQEKIAVEYDRVTSSTQQFGSLRDGEYDLIMTAPDNVAQYRLNESNALGETFDAQAVAGTNRGQNLSLVVRPDITSFEDLRGKTLAVDSDVSGFAFVLYQMMRNHGLERGTDYQIVQAGGSFGRLQGLLNNEFAGTLLLSGLELRAEAAGMTILEPSAETIPGYLGGVAQAARAGWSRTAVT